MKKIDGFLYQIGFPVMLNQSNEKCIFAVNVSISDKAENGVDGFEIPAASELVEKSRVRRVVMFEAHLVVLVEERQGLFWVLRCFDIGDERYRPAELCGVSVKSLAAAARDGGLGFVGAESLIWMVMGLQGIAAAMAEKVDRFRY